MITKDFLDKIEQEMLEQDEYEIFWQQVEDKVERGEPLTNEEGMALAYEFPRLYQSMSNPMHGYIYYEEVYEVKGKFYMMGYWDYPGQPDCFEIIEQPFEVIPKEVKTTLYFRK